MEPMLACAIKPDKLCEFEEGGKRSGYVMEPKLDGIRCVARHWGPNITLTSRGGKDLTEKCPMIVSFLRDHSHLPWQYLDGELGYNVSKYEAEPIIDFNRTMRSLGSNIDVSLEKQLEQRRQGRIIQFFVFDRMNPEKPNETDQERRRILEDWFEYENFIPSHPVVILPRMPAFDEDYYETYVEEGGEGVMLKNPNATYDPGGRHANRWYKLKKFDTTEAEIMGFTEGQGKYVGMCGALKVMEAYNGCEFSVAGMDDAWRTEFWKNQHKYVGKMIEVKHFGLTAGTPRFPQFLRMRPDLD